MPGTVTSVRWLPTAAMMRVLSGPETSQEALALAAVLAQPWVDVVLSGATTQDQLSDNLRAFDVPFAQADQDKLALLSETPAAYWGKRSELLWN